MKSQDKIRVLLLCNEFDSALAVRDAAVEAGLDLALTQVSSRAEFSSQLAEQDRPSVVLLGRPCKAHLQPSMAEILETIRELAPGTPVVVLNYEESRSAAREAALAAVRSGAADFLHRSELDRLPLILERARAERDVVPANDRLRFEVRQAADLMRESQKLVTIGRLAGSIAHEINNPLESVTNLLYLLGADEGLSERARDYLSLAQRELDRVAQIAKQTLNFYRDTPHPVRIQPSELIDEVLVLYSRRIAEKQIRVVREFETGRSITASPGEMRQVFSNLITNAIEATDRGGSLHLRIRDSHQWRGHARRGLRISIGDTGCGISSEVRHRLGEPFFTTKGQRGTGLGLWVTQSIIRRNGGSLQVSSSTQSEHHGTVFSIFLPASPRLQSVVAINEPHGTGHGAATQAAGNSPARILPSSGPGRNAPRQLAENYGTE